MKILIITGGSIEDTFAVEYLKEHNFDKIIAVDKGLEAVSRYRIIPDIIMGDFDSVDSDVLGKYRNETKLIDFPPAKDDTDTALAILEAIKVGGSDITILGALGGRMDHALANTYCMMLPLEKGIKCNIIDKYNKIYLLNSGKVFEKVRLYGKYISFIAMTPVVKGITLKGFKYALENEDLHMGSSRCISNEICCKEASIEFSEGILICIESRD
jgi:thiamine pyrophosphokinase